MEDIAICKDKEEWLSAWDLPTEKRLVFWGDKMYTDYSNSASQASGRMITMGTVLERMEETDPDALVINRLPLHNYAVYLPVRNEDGSYSKRPALINARECVSEDYLPHLFESFTREEKTTVNRIQGTGLGLAITAKVVELMGGTISVESTPGEGSEFVVVLDLESLDCEDKTEESEDD